MLLLHIECSQCVAGVAMCLACRMKRSVAIVTSLPRLSLRAHPSPPNRLLVVLVTAFVFRPADTTSTPHSINYTTESLGVFFIGGAADTKWRRRRRRRRRRPRWRWCDGRREGGRRRGRRRGRPESGSDLHRVRGPIRRARVLVVRRAVLPAVLGLAAPVRKYVLLHGSATFCSPVSPWPCLRQQQNKHFFLRCIRRARSIHVERDFPGLPRSGCGAATIPPPRVPRYYYML